MENDYKWRSGRYCVFKNFVHLVFVTKYRKGVFTKEMLDIIHGVLSMTCKRMDGDLLQFGGEEDHVHLLVSLSPKIALCQFVGQLKGASSYAIRNSIFGEGLKSKLWGKSLWSPSYCAVSCGGASLDVIKEYVKNQRMPRSSKGRA